MSVDDWNQVTALATIGLVFASLVTTVWIVFENRKTLRAERAPYVIAYIFPGEKIAQKFDLVIENIGKEPAFKVRFESLGRDVDGNAFFSNFDPNMKRHFEIIPPGRSIKFGIGVAHQILAKEPDFFLNMDIRYEDRQGKKHHNHFATRPSEFLETEGANDINFEIYQEIKRIRELIKSIPFSHDGIRVIAESRDDLSTRKEQEALRYNRIGNEKSKASENEFQLSQKKIDD